MTLEERDLRHIWHPCSQMKDYEELPPIPIARGSGVRLYDVYGKEYIDIVSSWWCNLLGHCNPAVNAAAPSPKAATECVGCQERTTPGRCRNISVRSPTIEGVSITENTGFSAFSE